MALLTLRLPPTPSTIGQRHIGPGRQRVATVTGVRFLDDDHLVALSLAAKNAYVIEIATGRIEQVLVTRHRVNRTGTDLADFDPATGLLVTSDCWTGISIYRWRRGRLSWEESIGLERLGGVEHPHGVRWVDGEPWVSCAATGRVTVGEHPIGIWPPCVRDVLRIDGNGIVVAVGLGRVSFHAVDATPSTALVMPGRRTVVPGQIDSIARVGDLLWAANQWTNSVQAYALEGGGFAKVRELHGYPYPHCIDVRGGRMAVACYGDDSVRVLEI